MVEEENPVEHCMSLGRVACSMKNMRNFLRNPYREHYASKH